MTRARIRILLALGGLCGALVAISGAHAADWPQWLGPERNGVSTETGLRRGFPTEGPPRLWKRPLGAGFSGIAVVGSRLFTMTADADHELVVAMDAETGRELWRSPVGDRFGDRMGGDGPRSTPTVDGDRVIALGAEGLLVALELASGRRLWAVDLPRQLSGSAPTWGYSASPLVHRGRVFVDAGGSGARGLAAFDRADGRVLWSAEEDRAGYSSPVLMRPMGIEQIVFFTGRRVVAVSPDAGVAFWQVPWKTAHDVNAATPQLVGEDRLFVSSGYGTGAAMLKVVREGDRLAARQLWKSPSMRNKMTTSVVQGGYIYGFSESTLTCIDANDGEVVWDKDGYGRGTLLLADGRLWALSEECELVVADATPEAYRELGRWRLLGERCWTMPSLSGGRLFARDEQHIASFDLRPATAPAPRVAP
ncbi:MAG: PQQ-like beta-propeller repeat protein [Deltaproteobacteria bacterium]|nr:PQQ-like beta-propeller repeat protein [Deltaproteobacteria bacterium]MCB9789312.1 PQQ-like beta-propeller repeat protein [Deltaproteobacteria bacterium]